MKYKIIFNLLLISLLFPGCAANRINSFNNYREKIIYSVDDKFFETVGTTADGAHIFFDTLLSYEIHFESEIDRLDIWRFANITNLHLGTPVRYYFSNIFIPMYTLGEFVEIVKEKDRLNLLFFNGFSEYIKNNENLRNVRIINIKMAFTADFLDYLKEHGERQFEF